MDLVWKTAALVSCLIPGALANAAMPVAQQNALVQKYCAVCHTDAVRNGGLSLEHFDAAQAAPSLAAMMVSKLKGGALGAAGTPLPDKATEKAFTEALVAEAAGADKWAVDRNADLLTASILRELPSAKLYRLMVSCNSATHEGSVQLAWAPSPRNGTLSVSVDGSEPALYQVEGREKMGNGTAAITGPAATVLSGIRSLPRKSLAAGGLFPNESVEFPFGELPEQARQSLAACFGQ